ncbi:hypothetical protein [Qipengyuania sp. MTN3-11]|uniref:hypothetical protein n=1 Tax=Qipengyuania sp. MTN3-11 TaxID=3056557 RepID=UPI0036F369D3
MNARSEPQRPSPGARAGKEGEGEFAPPLGGTRAQAMQRLQVGAAGVLAMFVLIGLVSVIENRAQQTEAGAVPEAASTAEPGTAAPRSDPLVEAGVVPDLPETPTPTASAPPPILREQGPGPDGERSQPIER